MSVERPGAAPDRSWLSSAARFLDYGHIDARSLVRLTMAVVFIGTVLRALFAASIDLGTDEAYYWTWSKENVLSFLDHPPMIAWFIRLGTFLFGDTTFGVRFMGIPALLAAEMLLADVVRRATGDLRASAFVILAMESTLGYGVVVMLAKPDVPLLPFAAATIFALARLDDTRDGRWWLVAGLCGGLALLSKYTAVFLLPAIFLFVLWPSRNRRWLLTPWPWLGLAVAVAVFSPVLWWNAVNDWASFRFQGTRLAASDFSPINAADFILVSLAFMGPILVPAITAGSIALFVWALRERAAVPLLVSAAFLLPLVYLLERSFSIEIIPTWPYVLWMFGIAAAAINASAVWAPSRPTHQARAAGIWTTIALVTGFAIVGAAYWHALVDRSAWFGRSDPLGREAGYDDLAIRIVATAEDLGAGWIATTDYRTYAMLRWHLGKVMPVIQVDERSRFIGFSVPTASELTAFALLVTRQGSGSSALPADARLLPVGTTDRVWNGITMETYDLKVVEGWQPDFHPSPDEPSYAWPQLALGTGIGWR